MTLGLLVEPYLGQGNILPVDYKFFVFGGRVEYIQVDTGRAQSDRRCFFNSTWDRQSFCLGYPLETLAVKAPQSLDRMIAGARVLGADFEFVRVDFYEVDARPLFGELTFYPGSGRERFFPHSMDRAFGNLWK
jgi:hypothetical protein